MERGGERGRRWVAFAAVALLGASLAGCEGNAPGAGKAAAPAKGSPEQEAVRKWLRETTQSDKWEEVRWHAEKPVNGKTLVRLKYRTANKSGAAELYDYWFTVQGGEASVTINVTGAPWVD